MQLLNLSKLVNLDLNECQPFVFKKRDIQVRNIPAYGDDILASPFEVFSIEADQGPMTQGDAEIYCIYCQELAPDNYKFVAYVGMNGQFRAIPFSKGGDGYQDILDLVHVYLERLYTDNQADTKYSGKAKYKTRTGKKNIFKPSEVIYVSDRAFDSNSRNGQGGVLKPRTSYLVRSHWRKLTNADSIGVDRVGKRTIHGHTWISTYQKGTAQITPKIRKVTAR